MRPQSMAVAGALALALGLAPAAPVRAAEPAQEESTTTVLEEAPVPAGPSVSVEATGSYHFVNTAYFAPAPKPHTTWGEGFTRLRVNYGGPSGLWGSVGGVTMGTAGTDYAENRDVGDGMLDQLEVGLSRIGDTGLSVVAGRQDLMVGDGFLIGDGYSDGRAALWNIPLNFYDAGRVDWKRGEWHEARLLTINRRFSL